MKATWWPIFLVLFLSTEAIAQRRSTATLHPETGRPFMTTFLPSELGGHPQTWDLLQDQRGPMYAGNGLGLVEFDGSEARLIRRAALEREVRERTAELQEQKEQIEQAYENVDLLSRIGRDIIATLETKAIIDTVYESVNNLMDTAVFGIGLYDQDADVIHFPATKEKGETLPPFNGPGMPKEVRDRIFEPFFTTKPTGSGTGLGLLLSYEIVTQGHGGSIHVVSNEGSGASFTVTLPVS